LGTGIVFGTTFLASLVMSGGIRLGSLGTGTRSRQRSAQALQSSRFSLTVAGRTLPLDDDARLTSTDIPGLQGSTSSIVAEVSRNPKDPAVLGLKNLSRGAWSARMASGEVRTVMPGKSIKLEAGTRINFGPVQGTVV
jgi:hypothetical protein